MAIRLLLFTASLAVMSFTSGMTMLLTQAQTTAVNSSTPTTTIAALRDKYRPLLVFAPTDNDHRFLEQAHLFAAGSSQLHERQVLFVPLVLKSETNSGRAVLKSSDTTSLCAAEMAEIRQRLHVSAEEFTVVLLGKDGGEKFRTHRPVTMERLNGLIDSMPMRQQEVQNGHSN